MIYSVYGGFGSGVTIPGYGFLLNNRAAQFTLDTSSPNVVAPGKRPFYTIIPGFVLKDGKPYLGVGVMSGDQQAQGQQQVLENMLDFGMNPQMASDAARFSHNQRSNRLTLESGLYEAVGPALKAMGHDVVSGNGRGMGGYQAIMVDPTTGILRGASDHRKDGAAVGYRDRRRQAAALKPPPGLSSASRPGQQRGFQEQSRPEALRIGSAAQAAAYAHPR